MSDTDTGAGATRDPTGLWRWMRFFVLVAMLTYVVTIVGAIATWLVVSRTLDVGEQEATIIDMTFAVGALGSLLFYVLSAIATARLTYRLMKNAHQLHSDEQLVSPGWAVGWYFIPFANLAMPPRAVGQIWRTTFRHLGQDRGSAIIGWWWAMWLISSIALGISDRMSGPSSGMASEDYYIGLSIGYVLRLICAGLLLVVFGTLAKAQKNLNRVADVFT